MKTSSAARMAEIEMNPDLRETIRLNMVGLTPKAGGPCPCPDCEGTLRNKILEYGDHDNDMIVLKEVVVLACPLCAFQVRVTNSKEGQP